MDRILDTNKFFVQANAAGHEQAKPRLAFETHIHPRNLTFILVVKVWKMYLSKWLSCSILSIYVKFQGE